MKSNRTALLVCALSMLFALSSSPPSSRGMSEPERFDPAREYYLFVAFMEPPPAGSGMHYAISSAGYKWRLLNDRMPQIRPMIGGTRDPFVTRGPGGDYHMVWTSGGAGGVSAMRTPQTSFSGQIRRQSV